MGRGSGLSSSGGSWVHLGFVYVIYIYMYAKHWEHSSKENTVPDFMDLIFYWKWNQGSRQTITKEAKLPYNVKWYMGLGSPKTDLRLNFEGFI